jgi:hypothetical protein
LVSAEGQSALQVLPRWGLPTHESRAHVRILASRDEAVAFAARQARTALKSGPRVGVGSRVVRRMPPPSRDERAVGIERSRPDPPHAEDPWVLLSIDPTED